MNGADPSEQPSVNWNYLYLLALRHKWLFGACFFGAMLVALFVLATSPRVYRATAVVQVEQEEQRAFKSNDQGDAADDDLKSDDIVKTIEQNLQSYNLFLDVVSRPEIANDPAFFVGLKVKDRPVAPSTLAIWLQSNTRVELRRGTRLIDVSVDHQVPAMAQKLAQAIVAQFIIENARTQTSTQGSDVQFLVEESNHIKDSLQKSEDSLQTYKEALLLKDRLDDEQRVLDALRQRYREKHPQLIQARALMHDLMLEFDREFQKVITTSPGEAAYWAANTGTLAAATPDARIQNELRLVTARANVLQKEVDTESALFDSVLKQMREADVTREATPTEIRLAEPAALPVRPFAPRKSLILAIGAACGLLLGAAAVAAVNAFDSSIKTTIEAEEILGLPVLGAIPLLESGESSRKSSNRAAAKPETDAQKAQRLVVQTDPGGAAAEAFRSLRAAISLLGKTEKHRSILFTSGLAGEGKTFTSCNYAVAVAQVGLKTLLIDMDLRRPSVHGYFSLGNSIGFTDVAMGNIGLKEAVSSQVIRNLDVLTSGSKCANPAELLTGPHFAELLQEALLRYDRVIIDSSPVNLVSDSLIIASQVERVCLVVRAAETPRRAIQHALGQLRRSRIDVSGCVLNLIPPWSSRLAYSYYSYSEKDGANYRHVYAAS
jgi:succinoglycan biosynthesis transport protein ExoP